jgi:hypothetical protein
LIAFSDATRNIEVRHIREACKELDLAVSAVRPRFDHLTPKVPEQPLMEEFGNLEAAEPNGRKPSVANGEDPQFWIEQRPSLLKRWIGMGQKEKE